MDVRPTANTGGINYAGNATAAKSSPELLPLAFEPMGKRWSNDERGRGVASAANAVPDLDRLRAAMLEPDWVAEDPDVHLLPHARRLCAERGWELTRADVRNAVLEIDVSAPAGTVRSPREAAFALLGTFAEASTHVVERLADVGREVEVSATTGMLEGDEGTGAFVPHGHTVRIRVVRV